MKRIIYYLLVLMWPVLNSCAQNAATPKPLNVGDTIPYIILTDVINFPVSNIHLSELKGKVIILDFWSTWCSTCINKFPLIDSIQREFKDRVQVILVNNITGTLDTKEKIRSFYKKQIVDKVKRFTVPIAMEDTVLSKIFPHIYLPHYVWIGTNNKVIGITSSEGFTRENVYAALRGDILTNGSVDMNVARRN